jgi:hypothetical protein
MPAILQVAPPAPRESPAIPAWSRTTAVTCTDSLSPASAVTWRPRPFRAVPGGLASGGAKVERILGSGQGRDRPQIIASAARLASDIAAPPVVAFAIAGASPRRRLKFSRGVGQIGSGDSLPKDPELSLACSSTRVVVILTETVKL